MRVSLAHDWLVTHRGGENVLQSLCHMYPDATIYTLVHRQGYVDADIESHPIVESFIAKLPLAPIRFRQYLPLFFWAIARLEVLGADVVISTSHCVAKGISAPKGAVHISYIHSPMRYLYDELGSYFFKRNIFCMNDIIAHMLAPLRLVDRLQAKKPDVLIANSHFVKARIRRVWGRDSHVIYPPVDVDYFSQRQEPHKDRHGLLHVGALVAYKRVDLAIILAKASHTPLTVIGDGPLKTPLMAQARHLGADVRFIGNVSRADIRKAYQNHEALVFAGVEDFGIVALEAVAAGCPVLARQTGGAKETIITTGDNRVGGALARLDADGMQQSLEHLRQHRRLGGFAWGDMCAYAKAFDEAHFVAKMSQRVEDAWRMQGKKLRG